jgi:hypothetical protein
VAFQLFEDGSDVGALLRVPHESVKLADLFPKCIDKAARPEFEHPLPRQAPRARKTRFHHLGEESMVGGGHGQLKNTRERALKRLNLRDRALEGDPRGD